MSLIPSISFISTGGQGRLRPQRVGWWCDLAELSVISGLAILAPLFVLGLMRCDAQAPQGKHCCCYQPLWLKSALTSQPQSGCPHTPFISIQHHVNFTSHPTWCFSMMPWSLRDKFRSDTSHAHTCTISSVVQRRSILHQKSLQLSKCSCKSIEL